MKAKRVFAVVVSMAIAATAAIGIAACGVNKTGDHEHTYDETKWEFNDATHWHEATCHEGVIKDVANHTMENGKCTVCDYEDPNYTPSKPDDPVDPDLDTRDLYVVGGGGTVGSLVHANWQSPTTSIKLAKKLDENKNTVYTVELELYADDEFKIIEPSAIKKDENGNDDWDTSLQFMYEDLDLTAVTEVTDPFSNNQSNIHVNQGGDGIYRFTIVTQKDAELKANANKAKVELIDKKNAIEVNDKYEMYIVGSVASKSTCNWPGLCGVAAVPTNCIKMDYDAATETFSVNVRLSTSDKFKVWNYKGMNANSGYYPSGTGNDLTVPTSGMYTVSWKIGDLEPTITAVTE